eukprot:1152416-Pelagomonas_calceolata.AAC.1
MDEVQVLIERSVLVLHEVELIRVDTDQLAGAHTTIELASYVQVVRGLRLMVRCLVERSSRLDVSAKARRLWYSAQVEVRPSPKLTSFSRIIAAALQYQSVKTFSALLLPLNLQKIYASGKHLCGCPLSPLLLSLHIHDVDLIAEDVQGAVTGTEDVRMTHMLHADDLTLLSNEAGAPQTMLCRLVVYARKKHLIINTVKSEVVHLTLKGTIFQSLNMAKSAENASHAVLTSAYRFHCFVREHTLVDRPHAPLWLAKTYVTPAGMYASQTEGTDCKEFGEKLSGSQRKQHCLAGWNLCVWQVSCNQEFTDDLRHRLRTVWRDVEGVNPRETYSKLATYQSIFVVPFDHNVRAPACLPRRVHLDLSQHVVRNVSRFRLRAHTLKLHLKVETAAWDTQNSLLCDRNSHDEIQDEVHALLICKDADVCALRDQKACLV